MYTILNYMFVYIYINKMHKVNYFQSSHIHRDNINIACFDINR